MQVTPFHFPELVHLISGYLSRSEMVNCLRVSKHLHKAFIALVWRDVIVQQIPRVPYPTGPSLRRHKHLIQSLTCYDFFDEYLTLRGCESLSTFYFSGNDTLADLSGFIATHSPTLRDISILPTEPTHRTPSTDLWTALAQCPNLQTLNLSGLMVSKDCSSYFRQICSTGRSLSFRNMIISDSLLVVQQEDEDTCGSQPVFLGPRSITMSVASSLKSPNLSPYCQALMIRACPNLETLNWTPNVFIKGSSTSNPLHPSTNAFLRTFAANPWTLFKLESLDLSGVYFWDKDFAQILCQMRQLKSLSVSFTRFGNRSFQEMIKKRAAYGRPGDGLGASYTLCDSVRRLELKGCSKVTGVMIQTLLASCPKLDTFHGGKVTVSEIAQGQEWVCQGISCLAIYLEADVDYHAPAVSPKYLIKQRRVFSRLGSLTNLKYLFLTEASDALNAPNARTLDLRLSAGMELLANLKNMKYLSFPCDSRQCTSVQEVDWMVRHWPKLWFVEGLTVTDDETRNRLAAVLDPAGVIF